MTSVKSIKSRRGYKGKVMDLGILSTKTRMANDWLEEIKNKYPLRK